MEVSHENEWSAAGWRGAEAAALHKKSKQIQHKTQTERTKTMADFMTKLSDMIDPEVMADMVSARIPKKLRVAPFANCLLYTSPSPRDRQKYRMPSSA